MSQLSLIRNTICTKLITEFDVILKLLAIVKNAIYGFISLVKTTLQTMQYSAKEALDNAVNVVNNAVDDIVPKIDESFIHDIMYIIQHCPFLCEHLNFKNPLDLLRSIQGEIKNVSANIINSLTSAVLEFNAAQLIDSIINKYGPNGFNLTGKIPNAIKIIDCVDALCSTATCGVSHCSSAISDRVTTFTNYLKDLYILSDGNFDRHQMYTDIMLSPGHVASIESALGVIGGIRNDIEKSLLDGVKFVKNLSLKAPPCA